MRKVYVDLKMRLILQINEGIPVADVVNELDYDFCDTTGEADVVATEIEDFEITDSK